MRSPLHGLFRRIVFWAGDTRRLHKFPWVTWDVHQHRIDLDEVIRKAIPLLRIGDIILHRDEGYLSNLFIGGFMIHAGIYIGDGYVVEAISDGVKRRHVAHILYSDYAMIVRPRLGDEEEREAAITEAVEWARKCEGCKYDELFNFNVEDEREAIKYGQQKKVKLACTEVPYLCYHDYVDKLKIDRRRNVTVVTKALSWLGINTGEEVVDADMYVKADFDVVWKSKDTTPEAARAHGCDEGYCSKLKSPVKTIG